MWNKRSSFSKKNLQLVAPYHIANREVRLCDETVFYNKDKAFGVFQGQSVDMRAYLKANKQERPAISLRRGIT